ncbi:hypothetical protein [Polyangium jinanense]|uniref:Outer membrane protein beta-barrel domain-containing protein n=1 Tax=Polyangium jinanense TaxID=2829994 RepID=A0A9X3XCA0_9BACT|nr:hypothetical protein [Polyangium jinanense]MDC3961860.1 hypothetical protein [Polyangium jinanense]MDC3987822.1 hypothetical protein [Polyangium jinanense]
MKTRLSKRCFGLSAALLLCAAPAAAQDSVSADAAQAGKVPPSDVRVGGYAGVFSAYERGATVGIHAQYRLGLFEVGGFGEGGTEFMSQYAGFGATAGLAWRAPFGLRLTACGALGLHAYQNVGARILSPDPGADGTTAFAGARVGASYVFGRGPNHVEVGMMGLYEGDLVRTTVTTHYQEVDWLDGNSREATSTHTVGTDRFGALVTVGWTRDLL